MRYDPKRHNVQFEEGEIQRLRQELARMQNENARLAALFTRTTPSAGVPVPVPPFARPAGRTPKPTWARRYGGRAVQLLLIVAGFAAGLWYANDLSRGEAWRGFRDGMRDGWTEVGR